MRRLYLRIYFAVLLSLGVFALAAGFLWRQLSDGGPVRQSVDIARTLALNALPPRDAPRAEQQRALDRMLRDLDADVSLFAPDRSLLASSGAAVPAPAVDRTRGGWVRDTSGAHAWAMPLGDGRWLVARTRAERPHPATRFFFTLALLALGVGVGAYPVVRRLTRRLERLQQGVESLGAGHLGARVPVEGRDEVARLAASFNQAAERIEALVGAHRTLLANASHELRTPLARIRMAIELMKDDADPERRRELEQDIRDLDALIEEILLTSRLDANRTLDVRETVDLLALAAEECARFDAVQVSGDPATVSGDARLLRRMVRNLVDNAVRHGAAPVEVRVMREADRVRLSVSDRGPGVAPDAIGRIFEPFYRGAHARDGGTGLGLSLVRSIATHHGGTALASGVGGGGACFVVELPASRGGA